MNLLQIASEPDGREMCVSHAAEPSVFLHSSALCSAVLPCFIILFLFSWTFALLQEQMFVLIAVVLCVGEASQSVHLVRHGVLGVKELFVTLYSGFRSL